MHTNESLYLVTDDADDFRVRFSDKLVKWFFPLRN